MKHLSIPIFGLAVAMATFAVSGRGLAAGPAAPPAVPQDGLLFHASFDAGVKADTAAGNPDPKVVGNVKLIEGVHGKAVMGGDSFVTALQYENAGNFQIEKGTVSFWIKPIDWLGERGKAKFFNLFMQGNGSGQGYFGIEMARFNQPRPNLLFYCLNYSNREKAFTNDAESMEWPNDQWHQVVLTWDDRQFKMFVDGEVSGTAQLTSPLTKEDLHSTAFQFFGDGEEHTALDEVRVWNRPLSAEEVASLFKSEKP